MNWILVIFFGTVYSYDFGSRCESIRRFPSNCHTICANLVFDENANLTEEELKVLFYNVKTILGSLTIQKTHFTTLKFLGNVEVIECDSNGSFIITENPFMTELGLRNLTRCACSMEVSNNENLARLNLPYLKYFSPLAGNVSQVEMSISNVSSDFCINIYDMQRFIANDNLYIKSVGEKFCAPTDGAFCTGICKPPNGTWKNVAMGCDIFNGSLTLTAGDENEVKVLSSVIWIFGQIRIVNTNLTKVNFLENLRYVTSLESSEAILVENNADLVEFSVPNLKKSVIHQPNLCLPYTDFNGDTELYVTEIDGEHCGELMNVNNYLGSYKRYQKFVN